MRRALAALFCAFALSTAVVADEPERKIDATNVKVGQRYRFKLTASNQSAWEITEKTDDQVTYRIHMTIAGKELPAGEPQRFPLKKKPKKDDPAKSAKKVGEETLEVSGIKYPCTIYETETGGTTVKTWQSNVFPEGIKTQMGKDVTQELVEIK
jgi:hypothetical protein